jgi:predicted RNase H-like HicB family nuclease
LSHGKAARPTRSAASSAGQRLDTDDRWQACSEDGPGWLAPDYPAAPSRSAVQQGIVRSDHQASRPQFEGGQAIRLKVYIHHEVSAYWSEIAELPGCFASGRTLTELHAALGEAIGLYLWDEPVEVQPYELRVGPVEVSVQAPQ